MDDENGEAGKDPPRHALFEQFDEGGTGGDQADDHVQHDVGQLGGAGDLADRGHGKDQADDGDQHDTVCRHVEDLQPFRGGVAQDGAQLRADCRHEQGQAKQEDEGREIDLLILRGSEFLVQTGRNFVEGLGVGFDPFVELRSQVDRPQQEHDPDRVVYRVYDRGTCQLGFRGLQGICHGDQVAGTAHPAAAEGAESAPGTFAKQRMHGRIGDEEAGSDGDGGGEEAKQHLRTEFQDLTDVAAQQHDEDHRVQDRVAESAVGGLCRTGIPEFEGASEHPEEVEQHYRRNIFKEFPLGKFLRTDEKAGGKDQYCKIHEAVLNHNNSSFVGLVDGLGSCLNHSTKGQ